MTSQDPLRLADDGELLVRGRHRATLDQVHDFFVVRAPFAEERRIIWDAFLVYHHQVRRLLPSAKLWLDGGFVTYKTWAPPKDIDVCIVGSTEEIEAAGPAIQPLLTITEPTRVQPMSGLVDGFIAFARPDQRSNTEYWAHQWSRVQDLDGNEDAERRKGFVEVRNS